MENNSGNGFKFIIEKIDVGPDDLLDQLPLLGQVLKVMPGPDRPDYVVAKLNKPISYKVSRRELKRAKIRYEELPPEVIVWKRSKATITITGLLFIPHFVGANFHHGMVDMPIAIAYVLDPAVFTDEVLNLSKACPVGAGFLTHLVE